MHIPTTDIWSLPGVPLEIMVLIAFMIIVFTILIAGIATPQMKPREDGRPWAIVTIPATLSVVTVAIIGVNLLNQPRMDAISQIQAESIKQLEQTHQISGLSVSTHERTEWASELACLGNYGSDVDRLLWNPEDESGRSMSALPARWNTGSGMLTLVQYPDQQGCHATLLDEQGQTLPRT